MTVLVASSEITPVYQYFSYMGEQRTGCSILDVASRSKGWRSLFLINRLSPCKIQTRMASCCQGHGWLVLRSLPARAPELFPQSCTLARRSQPVLLKGTLPWRGFPSFSRIFPSWISSCWLISPSFLCPYRYQPCSAPPSYLLFASLMPLPQVFNKDIEHDPTVLH